MLPWVNILRKQIGLYGVWIGIGLIIGSLVVVFYFSKFYEIKRDDVIYSILFGVIGLMIGAKLLSIITLIPRAIAKFPQLGLKDTFIALIQSSGFVFYGGLIGGILGIYIYSKMYKIPFDKLLMIIVPAIPLVHSFGRIGCLFAGCCYGMEYNGFGSITFSNTPFAPIGIPLFPSQIVESICNFIIFLIILITYKKFNNTYKSIGLYCISYSIVRFTLEFFRGDIVRGFILNISTSQWISIVLFIIGISLFIYEYKRKKVENT